jgi:hypothetical protein
LDHEKACDTEWRKVRKLLQDYIKGQQSSQKSFEPAELDEEDLVYLLFEELPFNSSDAGYDGSSDITDEDLDPEIQFEPRGEVQVQEPRPGTPDEEAQQLPVVPEEAKKSAPKVLPRPGVSRPAVLSHQLDLHQTEEDSEAFYSLTETEISLSNTLTELDVTTRNRLELARTPEEYDEILAHYHREQQRLGQRLQRLQPTTSTPDTKKKKKSPLSKVDQFLFGDLTSPVPRQTRSHGAVEDLPLLDRHRANRAAHCCRRLAKLRHLAFQVL